MLGCGKDKAVRLFKELDMGSGIGLIERRKQGQGKPARVYVKKFTLPADPNATETGPPPTQTSEIPKSGLPDDSALQTSEKSKSALLKSSDQDFGISAANKTDKSNTESSDTDLSIHPPASLPRPRHPSRQDSQDRMDQMDYFRAMIHENIGYRDLLREHPCDADLIDGYVELMVEVCCSRQESKLPNKRIEKQEDSRYHDTWRLLKKYRDVV